MEQKALEAIKLYKNTPDGTIYDADTILADIIEQTDTEVTKFGLECICVWLDSKDRKSVENMFLVLTGVEFEDYLDRCIAETTR